MTSQYIMSQLLKSDAKNLNNIDLLKKIILTVSLGRLQINGQLPDKAVILAKYLFSQERIILDFSRVAEKRKISFLAWLLQAHQQDKIISYSYDLAVNEYRGYTAEGSLSWFGRLGKWIKREHTEHWSIAGANFPLNYNISTINMCHGQHGVLIGFDQSNASVTKIDPDEPQSELIRNTNRVFITDHLIELIQKKYLQHHIDYEALCHRPHPLSVDVPNYELRYQNMLDYRKSQQYTPQMSWYQRLWSWFISWFKKDPIVTKETATPSKKKLTKLYETETIKIFQRSNQQLIVQEKKPDIENLVYAGGGARMFAHVGVWQALQEAKIVPKRFAGSSAGAIMGLVCYLGFSAKDIRELFQNLKKEHVVYFNINSKGLSDARAMKTALDYFIALKIDEVVTKYGLVRPQGRITFAILDSFRKQCPDCGIGEEFVVTATNKHLSETSYFSALTTPDMEVSEAVKVSCSIPLVFRDTQINGYDFNDGGVLNNFPTNVFHLGATTFLESEYGNNLKTLAVQFDTGIEYSIVNQGRRISKEHFIVNWILGFLAGVNDVARSWEQDRLRLRKYSGQTILIDAKNVAVADFNIKEERKQLEKEGYLAAQNYLFVRYGENKEELYVNKEWMYSTFNSLDELLIYTCYRGDLKWFNIICDLINQSSSLDKLAQLQYAKELHSLYFEPIITSITHEPSKVMRYKWHDKLFLILYPILLKLSAHFIKNAEEHDLFERARHVFMSDAPLAFLANLAQIKGETHILFYIFYNVTSLIEDELSQLSPNNESLEKYFAALQLVNHILESSQNMMQPELFAQWNVNFRQVSRILKCFENNSIFLLSLCNSLKHKEEPLQVVSNQVFHEELQECSLSLLN